jgi:hypothetical protein
MARIALTWVDNSNNEDGFHIYRSIDGAAESLLSDVVADSTTFTDGPDLAAGTYVYSVSAFNSAGESAHVSSNSVIVVVTAPVTVPAAPTDVTATLQP